MHFCTKGSLHIWLFSLVCSRLCSYHASQRTPSVILQSCSEVHFHPFIKYINPCSGAQYQVARWVIPFNKSRKAASANQGYFKSPLWLTQSHSYFIFLVWTWQQWLHNSVDTMLNAARPIPESLKPGDRFSRITNNKTRQGGMNLCLQRPIRYEFSIHRQRPPGRQGLQTKGSAGDVAHVGRADRVMCPSLHREEQSQQSCSGDACSHKSQVNEAIVESGLGCSMKVGPQVGLIEGHDQDKVSLYGDPVSGGKGLVERRQQVIFRKIQR